MEILASLCTEPDLGDGTLRSGRFCTFFPSSAHSGACPRRYLKAWSDFTTLRKVSNALLGWCGSPSDFFGPIISWLESCFGRVLQCLARNGTKKAVYFIKSAPLRAIKSSACTSSPKSLPEALSSQIGSWHLLALHSAVAIG